MTGADVSGTQPLDADEPSVPISFYGYARSEPDRIALITSEACVTFGALGSRVNQVSQGLQNLGLKPGDRLAQIVENNLTYPEVWERSISGWAI